MRLTSMAHAALVAMWLMLGATSGLQAADPGAWQGDAVDTGGATQAAFRYHQPIAAPTELSLRFYLTQTNSRVTVELLPAEGKVAQLTTSAVLLAGPRVQLTAMANGQKLHTVQASERPFSTRFEPQGSIQYGWRFPAVRNLWDDHDRAEIGQDYSDIVPLTEKPYTLRMVLTDKGSQLWMDSRLLAEHRTPLAEPATLVVTVVRGAKVESLTRATPPADSSHLSLDLTHYGHSADAIAHSASTAVSLTVPGGSDVVPMHLLTAGPALDLSRCIWRYRLTHGSGPDAPYVNGRTSWPDPFDMDPAEYNLRVPYRPWQTAYLAVWVDDRQAGQVPRGVLRFYKSMGGYCATSAFEVTDAAIAAGNVVRTDRTAPNGQPIYLVRVPVDTDAFYGFNDQRGELIDLQITKPVSLLRGYPDPIYYGEHPAGPDSSLRVVGVTLASAPFSYEVKPLEYGHLFEQPQQPQYTLALSSESDTSLPATVTLETTSYDGTQTTRTTTTGTLPARGQADLALTLKDVTRLGWHELRIRVQVGEVVRQNTLSLVLLPPNDRTYGNALNETRFGAWNLLGHYVAFSVNKPANDPILASLRKIGIRLNDLHTGFFTPELLKKYDFLPGGPHTIVAIYHRLKENDPEQVRKMLDDEWKLMEPVYNLYNEATYFYGGEWGFDHSYTHAVNPRYTGQGPWPFDEAAMKNLRRQMTIFETIGRMMRQKAPSAKLVLQWGGPQNTIPFLEHDFPKELVDAYGMDMPMFELTPEVPVAVGTINYLWTLRQEAARTGWPQHGIYWCEGPFLPTNPGALTLQQQAEHYPRYWLTGMAYNIERFEAGIVPHDAGNYYGAEHYGAGVWARIPLECPKPAVATLATTTRMVCGADVAGRVPADVLTTFGLSFLHQATGDYRHALWRVRGEQEVDVQVAGQGAALLTDGMGNTTKLPITAGKVRLTISPAPVWLQGAGVASRIIPVNPPRYDQAPAATTVALADFTSGHWRVDRSPQDSYAQNHVGVNRQVDPNIAVALDGSSSHGPAAKVTLPARPVDDKPLMAGYVSLVPAAPLAIPGQASALGVWINGNASWGRVVYQVRDAKGEVWTSVGTAEDWNCDDTHTWSFVNFEGWRYVRFPLPSNHPWDQTHGLEITWWKHEGGDGVVDQPLRLERVLLETRNSTHWLGEMKVVPQRSFELAGLQAEYDQPGDQTDAVLARYAQVRPTPQWQGPQEHPLAKLQAEGVDPAPAITGWEPPHQWNDGRRMIIRFPQEEGAKYLLYLSRYPDGRGAEQMRGNYTDGQLVVGMRPKIDMYFFLVRQNADGKLSKPSPVSHLVTEDKFAEK